LAYRKQKRRIPPGFLDSLSAHVKFTWHVLPANGTTGGIVVDVRGEYLSVSNFTPLKFSVSCQIYDRRVDLRWQLVVVYGPSYEDRKAEFIDELHLILSNGLGPIIVGGDFNLSRFPKNG
jgi:hypothetical protein